MKENENKIESTINNTVGPLFSKKLKRSILLRTHICGVIGALIGALLTPCSICSSMFCPMCVQKTKKS